MAEMVGQLGLQRRLDDPPGELREQATRSRQLVGPQALTASSSAASGSRPARRSMTSVGGSWLSGSALGSGRRLDFIVLMVIDGSLLRGRGDALAVLVGNEDASSCGSGAR
jgi:hypothetical protein